jgi:hypothetical protein
VEDWEVLLGAKVDVSTEKKNIFMIGNLKLVKEYGLVVTTKFKARHKKLLNL